MNVEIGYDVLLWNCPIMWVSITDSPWWDFYFGLN